jgi:hypothetical protein
VPYRSLSVLQSSFSLWPGSGRPGWAATMAKRASASCYLFLLGAHRFMRSSSCLWPFWFCFFPAGSTLEGHACVRRQPTKRGMRKWPPETELHGASQPLTKTSIDCIQEPRKTTQKPQSIVSKNQKRSTDIVFWSARTAGRLCSGDTFSCAGRRTPTNPAHQVIVSLSPTDLAIAYSSVDRHHIIT